MLLHLLIFFQQILQSCLRSRQRVHDLIVHPMPQLFFIPSSPLFLRTSPQSSPRLPFCSLSTMPPPRPSASTPPSTLNIGHLLGACIHASRLASDAIRSVQTARRNGTPLTESYKDLSDPRSALTVADLMAQAAIVPPLQRQFPGLAIVAEEDESDIKVPDETVTLDKTLEGLIVPEKWTHVDVNDVCVFVDPLDGTLSFVKGNLEAVSSLIGISYRGEPIAGVVARPFVQEHPLYALVGAGVVNLNNQPWSRDERGLVVVASKGLKDQVVKDVVEIIQPQQLLAASAAGNKMMQVACGKADVGVLNLITSLWDTCATQAVITATGGTVTDLFGNPIVHGKNSRVQNKYGVLVSGRTLSEQNEKARTHKAICKNIRQSKKIDLLLNDTGLSGNGKIQATDIALDIDGNPLTCEWLSGILKRKVVGFSADDDSAVRYLMSDACRLRVKFEGETYAKGEETYFMKRIVMKYLEHVKLKARTAPRKLTRDVTSYQVEASFLSSVACHDFCAAGAKVVKSVYVDSRPAPEGVPPIESRFFMLLEDFNPEQGWVQDGFLHADKMNCALDSLASLHAYFWNFSKQDGYEELVDAVWDQGTYWVPKRQAADSFERIPACWEMQRQNFAEELKSITTSEEKETQLQALGHKLAEISPQCAEKVHGVGLDEKNPHRTLIHGDAKAANFFFKPITKDADDRSECEWEVGLIDFQWSGWGHPALDLAYLIAASAAPELLTHDGQGERDLLCIYYERFIGYLVKYGKAASSEEAKQLMSMEDLEEYYNACLLDLARLVVSYHWDRIKANAQVLESRKDMLGSNTYNKNVECAVWLIARTMDLLSKT